MLFRIGSAIKIALLASYMLFTSAAEASVNIGIISQTLMDDGRVEYEIETTINMNAFRDLRVGKNEEPGSWEVNLTGMPWWFKISGPTGSWGRGPYRMYMGDFIDEGIIPPAIRFRGKVIRTVGETTAITVAILLKGGTYYLLQDFPYTWQDVPRGCLFNTADLTHAHPPQMSKAGPGTTPSITSNIGISCTIPSTVKIREMSGGQVPTSNANVTAKIDIGGQTGENTYSVGTVTTAVPITSALEWTDGLTAAGPVFGSGVLIMEIQ